MKRHDEGYTLPYVLVILMILYFVVVAVLSSAEATVTAQQKSIAQMKQKYAAQGKIEMLVGQLCEETAFTVAEEGKTDAKLIGNHFSTKIVGICDAMAVDENEKITPEMNGDDVKGTYVPIADTSEFTYTFTITSVYHSVPVETKMTLTGTISKETTEDLPAETTYSITDLSVAYKTYQIGGDAS